VTRQEQEIEQKMDELMDDWVRLAHRFGRHHYGSGDRLDVHLLEFVKNTRM
jgi:hypothetical protein